MTFRIRVRVASVVGLLLIGVAAPPIIQAQPAGSSAAIAATGVTQAFRDLKLSITTAGRVEGLLVKEGDRVRKGDLLLHLDRNLEALEVQKRRLILQDDARLEELRAREHTLAEQVRSAQTLLASGSVSRKQVEDEQIAWRAIIAERKALEFGKLREQVDLDLAREAYERRHLRAPIDGVITKILAREGESVAPHEPVILMVNTSRVRFTGTVPVADGGNLRLGARVSIELAQGLVPTTREATIVFVSPVADPASGLLEVIAEFDNLDGSVRPGVAGRIRLGPAAAPVSTRSRPAGMAEPR
jgi:RND family efflux transporter MFP subunit